MFLGRLLVQDQLLKPGTVKIFKPFTKAPYIVMRTLGYQNTRGCKLRDLSWRVSSRKIMDMARSSLSRRKTWSVSKGAFLIWTHGRRRGQRWQDSSSTVWSNSSIALRPSATKDVLARVLWFGYQDHFHRPGIAQIPGSLYMGNIRLDFMPCYLGCVQL